MSDGTFAAAAAQGHYFGVTCLGCRDTRHVSARSLCAQGFGASPVVGSQARFRCRACGHRGVPLTVHGYWTGPWPPPGDWAETVEERMGGG